MADNQKAVIDQIYEKINEVLGTDNQLFSMEFPGRVLDENTYAFKADSIYSNLTKPQPVLEEEFRLTNQLFDVAQVTGGPNGAALSDTYILALNNLVPKYQDIPDFDNDKTQMREWLLENVETGIKDQPTLTRMQLFEVLNQKYLNEKQQWDQAKTQKLEDAENSDDPLQGLDEYSRWLAEVAPIREAEIESCFADSVVRGYYHEIKNMLGYLDISSEAEALEKAKARMRNSSMSSLDESETIYPTEMQPTDWFKGLSTDFKPIDLLLDPEVLQDELLTKERTLASLEEQYQQLSAAPTGNIDELKKQVAEAQSAYDQAQTKMIEHFSNVTITLAQWYFKKKDQSGEQKAKNEFNKIAGSKGVPPLSDEQWKQLSTMQDATIQAQQTLNSTSRALSQLEADEAAAESTNTKQELISLNAKIESMRQEIAGLKEVVMSQFGNNSGSDTYVISQDAVDAINGLSQEDKTNLMKLSGNPYGNLDDFTAAVKSALSTDWTQDIQDSLNTSCKQVAMVPSSMPAAGRFFDVIMSFDGSTQKDDSSLSKGSEHTSWSVDVLFGSAGGSSDKSWSDYTHNYNASNTSFDIGMRVTKVTIDRGGWFQPELFKASKNMFSLDPNTKFSFGAPTSVPDITQAECNALNKGLLPCFPTSFVIAKDVTIKVKMDSTIINVANSVLNKSSSVGGGFLCFSASHSSTSSKTNKSYYCGTQGTDLIIRIPGPQILGWYQEFTAKDESSNYAEMPSGYLPKDGMQETQSSVIKAPMGAPELEEVAVGPTPTGTIVVLSGHGRTANTSFNFKSASKSYIYSYVFENVGIYDSRGNRVEHEALDQNTINSGYADVKSSKIGGVEVRDLLLSSGPDLDIYVPRNFHRTIKNMQSANGETIQVAFYHNGATIEASSLVQVCVISNNHEELPISEVVNLGEFKNRAIDYLWVACKYSDESIVPMQAS